MKKIGVIILALLILFLLGCNAGDKQGQTEESQKYKKIFYDCGMSMNSGLESDFCFCNDEIFFRLIKLDEDGLVWQEFASAKLFSDDYYKKTGLSIQTDSIDKFSVIQSGKDTKSRQIVICDEDSEEKILFNCYNESGEEEKRIEISREDYLHEVVNQFVLTNRGNVIFLAGGNIYSADDSKEVALFSREDNCEYVKFLVTKTNEVYAIAEEYSGEKLKQKKVVCFNEQGKPNKRLIIPLDSCAFSIIDGELLFLSDNKIYSINKRMDVYEQVVDFSEEKPFATDYYSVVKDGKNYGIFYKSSSDNVCRTVVFDFDGKGVKDKTVITIYDTTGNMSRICPDTIISSFNETNPNYFVVIQNNDMDLNYVLASDKVPDIMIVDQARLDMLGQSGYLEDLYPLLEKDTTKFKDEIIEGLIDKIKQGGCLYSIPRSLTFEVIGGDKIQVGEGEGWTTEEFLEWLIETPEALKDSFMNKMTILQYCLEGTLNRYVDLENSISHLDEEPFANLLKKVNNVKQYPHGEGSFSTEAGMIKEVGVRSMYELLLRGLKGNGFVYKGYPTYDGSPKYLLKYYGLSILNTSKNKDAAFEFVKYFSRYRYGDNYLFFSNQNILDKAFEINKEEYWPIPELSNIMLAVGDNEYEDFMKIYRMSELYDYSKDEIIKMIQQEALNYCNGKKDLDEVINVIHSRIQLYLDEKK